VVYNAALGERVLRECADFCPEEAEWGTQNAIRRIVDLMGPFRSFHFYAPNQHGSVSLKSVLPALIRRGYDTPAGPEWSDRKFGGHAYRIFRRSWVLRESLSLG
jgi:hypothetical protein